MEFTVIGPTVNLASRLEQLNKKYLSHLVISETVANFTNLGHDWTVHSNVSVRGIENPLSVAVFVHSGLKELKDVA
jgi:adenylate cyclase